MVFLLGMDRKKQAKKIIKLPSSGPEARDEGPRPLPLDKQQQPTFRAMDHYLDLADKLLVPKPKTRQDKG